MVSEDDGTSSSDRRAIEVSKTRQRSHNKRLFQCLSTASPVRVPERQEPLPLPNAPKWPGWSAVDPAGTAASGLLLQAFYTVPEQYQQSLGDRCAHCRVLRTLPGFRHSIARRLPDEVPSS